MHRFRSWTLDPPEYRTQRNRLLPIEGGDGSTLNLDFTTGVLDPRLKFDRLGNATFINSSGLVQYADANLILQSESLATAPWSKQPVTPAVQVNDVSITNPIGGSTATEITAGGANGAVLQGPTIAGAVPHTIRFWIRAGTATRLEVGYFSGGFQSGTATVVSGGTATIAGSSLFLISNLTSTWTQIQIVLSAPASGGSLLFYPDTAGSPVAGRTLYIWGVQMNAGRTASPYYRTTTTTYQGPRFDHDPTTLAPRGLLIEGSANNLVTRSQTLNTTAWLKSATNISETGTGSPANDATSNVLTWTNGTAVGSAYTEQSSIAVSSSQPYTWSVWLKNRGNQRVSVFGYTKTSTNTFSGNLEMTVDFSVATPTASITASANFTSTSVTTPVAFGNGWYRCTMTGTTPSTAVTTGFGISNKDAVPASGTNGCEVWGAQLETGSGASSYIPTGANQGNRAKDECSITGESFSSWFTNPNEGSFFVQYSMNYPSASMGASIDRYAFEISDSVGSSRALCIAAYRNAPAGQNVRVFNPSGSSFDSGNALTTSSALNTKFAFGYATANNYIAAVGVAQAFQTFNTGSLPTSPAINQMWLGSNRNLSSTTYLFGCIRTIKYWPTRLPNATLQGLVS